MTRVSLCPDSKTLEDYKEALQRGVTLEEMTPDQAWCNFHLREGCEECKAKVTG